MKKGCPRVVITDVDNTLFDWIEMWEKGFRVLLKDIVELAELDEAEVKRSIRRANQSLGTSEHDDIAFHLDIFDDVMRHHQRENLYSIGRRFRASKEAATRLYPDVAPAMSFLRSQGIRIFCLTESVALYAETRLSQLGLTGLVDGLICSKFPGATGGHDVAHNLRLIPVTTFPFELRKPNPRLLRLVSEVLEVPMSRLIYVGDSLYKDVVMGNVSGVEVCWARYGDAAASPSYATLREVSHWPDVDIEADRNVRQTRPQPDHILSKGFHELVEILKTDGK
jgi:phosphoglycolate phosphatase